MPRLGTLPYAIAMLLWVTTGARAEVTVSMVASPTRVQVGDQVVLKVEVSTDEVTNPTVRIPQFEGFEIVQRSVSRPMQFSFGTTGRQVRSASNYTFVLQALDAGTFTLQPAEVTVGNTRVRSQKATITVVGPSGQPVQPVQPQQAQGDQAAEEPTAAAGAYVDGAQIDPQAFLRTVVDKPRPYVHEQVTVTIYLYTRDRLRAAPAIDTEPTTDGLWTRELLEANKVEAVSRQAINGMRFNVYVLRRFAAFPLKPGPVTIGPLGLSIPRGNVFDLFSGRNPAQALERVGVPVELDVQPLPEGGPDPATVAVGDFTIEAKLDRNQVATGDAVTLTATVRGHGQLTTVRLSKPVVDGLEVFDPQIKDLVEAPQDLVGGTRIYEWLVVPQRPGNYQIPPFVVPVFDAQRQAYGEARSTPLGLAAAGKAPAIQAPAATSPVTAAVSEPSVHDLDALELAPIRNHSKLSKRIPPVTATAYYPYLVASAPAAWLLMLLLGVARRRLRAARRDPTGQAARTIRTHLGEAAKASTRGEAAAVHAAVAAALRAALEQSLGEAIGSHTHAQLARRLADRGMDGALSKRIVQTLEHGDVARFSPADAGQQSLAQTVDAARALIEAIGRAQVAR